MFAQVSSAILSLELRYPPRLAPLVSSIRQSLLVPGLLSDDQRALYRARLHALNLAVEEKRALAASRHGERH